jgi:hypothetical protein
MGQPRPTESPFEENGTADPFLLGRISGRIEEKDLRSFVLKRTGA